ncbi:MAG: hypothetical protein AAGI71_07475 [Bacteroidota bacterium]
MDAPLARTGTALLTLLTLLLLTHPARAQQPGTLEGYVYEAGSSGGAGMNRYAEMSLQEW